MGSTFPFDTTQFMLNCIRLITIQRSTEWWELREACKSYTSNISSCQVIDRSVHIFSGIKSQCCHQICSKDHKNGQQTIVTILIPLITAKVTLLSHSFYTPCPSFLCEGSINICDILIFISILDRFYTVMPYADVHPIKCI